MEVAAGRDVSRLRAAFGALHPAKQVALGYLSYGVAGWLLLCLPFMHQARGLSGLDHLFRRSRR
jgi:hypothetical protein